MKNKCSNNLFLNRSFLSLGIAGVLLAACAVRADTIFVSNSGNGTITKFTGGVPTTFATGLSVPEGLALDGAGNLFVANRGNNTIMKFTPGGVGSIFANTGLNNPEGICFDKAGNLYVNNIDGSYIQKFTPGGVGSLFASVANPAGICLAIDGTGNLYATTASPTNSLITKFTPAG